MLGNDSVSSLGAGDLTNASKVAAYSQQQFGGAMTSQSVTHRAEKQSLLYFSSTTSSTTAPNPFQRRYG